MKTVFKILKKIVLIGLGVYAALFAVFFFDLDGKALFYGVEPFLCRHYDRMEASVRLWIFGRTRTAVRSLLRG